MITTRSLPRCGALVAFLSLTAGFGAAPARAEVLLLTHPDASWSLRLDLPGYAIKSPRMLRDRFDSRRLHHFTRESSCNQDRSPRTRPCEGAHSSLRIIMKQLFGAGVRLRTGKFPEGPGATGPKALPRRG